MRDLYKSRNERVPSYRCLGFSADGKFLATAESDGDVKVNFPTYKSSACANCFRYGYCPKGVLETHSSTKVLTYAVSISPRMSSTLPFLAAKLSEYGGCATDFLESSSKITLIFPGALFDSVRMDDILRCQGGILRKTESRYLMFRWANV